MPNDKITDDNLKFNSKFNPNTGVEDDDWKVGVSWNQIVGGCREDVAGSPLILSLSPLLLIILTPSPTVGSCPSAVHISEVTV